MPVSIKDFWLSGWGVEVKIVRHRRALLGVGH